MSRTATSGINASAPVSISGDGSPQFRIAGGSWGTSGSITDGQSLEVRLTSANAFSTARSATVDVGGVTDNWSVTTLAQDTAPNGFSFSDQTNVPLNTLRTSNSIMINGITGSVNVSVSGQGSPRVRINGGSWVSSGTIQNGQSLQVRLTSANAGTTARSASVTVGSGSDNWSVTTEDPGPTGCPNVGNTCSDGSIFAGDIDLYVPDVDQATYIVWSTETVNTSADSYTDGAANQQWIVNNRNLNDYPASSSARI